MNDLYIVELEAGCWLHTDSRGDPGRTVVRDNATNFRSMAIAAKALARAREHRPFANAIIEPRNIAS